MRTVPLSLAFILALTPVAPGVLIDLDWQPQTLVVTPGETVSVQLLAVSQDILDDVISVMDVIFLWDPAQLSLQGVVNEGPYNWLSSGLPVNAPGGLNVSLTDGDAMYTARSQFPPSLPAMATPSGLWVTTFRFTALAPTPSTTVQIVEERNGVDTIVVSVIPGLDISGTLGSAEIIIADCDLFDFDADGDVDLRDFQALQRCAATWQSPPYTTPCLCSFDVNRNGALDVMDYIAFDSAITGPSG